MIKRLRPAHSPERLQEIYAEPHDSSKFRDHDIRVRQTAELAHWMLDDIPHPPKIADLSCGDGRITSWLDAELWMDGREPELHRGDFAKGHTYTGPIAETIREIPKVDLFILSETLEHLDEPFDDLRDIREKTDLLVLSTPISEPWDSTNEQHYWSWDVEDVCEILRATGFQVMVKNLLYLPTYYDFMILGCR